MASYSFAADPRAAPAQRKGAKFRDPALQATAPANIMYDSRVRRGNTYSGPVHADSGGPGGGATMGASGTMGSTGRRTKMLPQKPSIFDVKPPTREHVEVDVTPFLVEQVEEVPEVEVMTQTDVFQERPDTPDYVPKKTGIDVSTQIDATDNLFNFDREVAPILEVICSKTLEQALVEVEEEGELAAIELRKQDLEEGKRREKAALRRMEEEETKKFEAKVRRKKMEANRVRAENTVRAKVAAMSAARNLTGLATNAAMAALEREGRFRDPVKDEIEADFLPWIYSAVGKRLEDQVIAGAVADQLIRDSVARAEAAHAARREAERQAREEAERKAKEEEERRGFLRVFVKGVVGEDGEPKVVGPIPVTKHDTVAEVEAKIKQWLQDNLGDDYTPPEDGFMRLGYGGTAMPADTTLLDADVPDNGSLELMPNSAEDADAADAE